MHHTTHVAFFSLLCLIPLLTAGCRDGGPELGAVSGTIKLDDEPLADAEVEFQPGPGGSPSYGKTDENGYYELKYSPEKAGAMVGEHLVRISTFGYKRGPNDRPIHVPERVPPKYNEQSALTREVKPGHNEFDFDL